MAVLGCRGCETPASPLHGVDRNVSGRTDAGSQSQRAGQDDKTAGGGVRGKRRVVPASGLPGRRWGESPQKSWPRDLQDRSARVSVGCSLPRGAFTPGAEACSVRGCLRGGAGCVSVPLLRDCPCPCLSHSLFSLWPSLSASFPLSAGLCVCVCPCACVCSVERALCARKRPLPCRPGSAEPLSASVPGSCGGSSTVFASVPLWVPEGLDHVRRCVFPAAMEMPLPLPSQRTLSRDQDNHQVQPGTKAPEELVALQERSRPASEETLVPFQGASLSNEATPRPKLEEEAGKGRCQASQSLERWPLWTSRPLGNPPLRPAAVAPSSHRPGLRPLLCPPSCSVCPVSQGPGCFSVWLNVFSTDRFPVRQGGTPRRSVW